MEVLKRLEELGYRVFLKEGKVCYEYQGEDRPDPKIIKPLILELREHREEILEYLKFTKPNLALRVKSKVLDREVYFASNQRTKDKVEGEGLATYLPNELEHLIRVKPEPEDLKKINFIKETFPGSELV
jgi:hypothetical protein